MAPAVIACHFQQASREVSWRWLDSLAQLCVVCQWMGMGNIGARMRWRVTSCEQLTGV